LSVEIKRPHIFGMILGRGIGGISRRLYLHLLDTHTHTHTIINMHIFLRWY